MKRKMISLLLASAICVSVAACGSSDSAAANSTESGDSFAVTEPVTIEFWHTVEEQYRDELDALVAQFEEENLISKSDYHLHATFKQRLEAVHKLRLQHDRKLLCKVPGVNRST